MPQMPVAPELISPGASTGEILLVAIVRCPSKFWAINVVQCGQHARGSVVDDVVEERLCLPAEGDDAVFAQTGQMLRKGRLAEAHFFAERGNT